MIKISIFAALFKIILNKKKMESNQKENIIEEVTKKDYEFGFVTDIETDFIRRG